MAALIVKNRNAKKVLGYTFQKEFVLCLTKIIYNGKGTFW